MNSIFQKIVSGVIISKDKKVLLVRESTNKGVYSGCWHNVGGSIVENIAPEETLLNIIDTNFNLNLNPYTFEKLDFLGEGESTKINSDGSLTLVKMEFQYFEINVDNKNANEIAISSVDVSIETGWFSKLDLLNIKLTPPGIKLYRKMGILD